MDRNVEKSAQVYFSVRVVKEPNGNACYDTVNLEREDLARIIARALRAEGFETTLTKFTEKKVQRLTWKDIKV